ncbi:hypothetical protein ACTFQF_14230 [Aliivibrio fischeri]|uniref:hypothetical protein n=1 Tax=Aliivibrio fischeri TaxID=668 RepID=UPI0007C4A196|nr:hypothetical protein [Aliivibrio fischeri]MBP3142250.1 hypothetical protein [Aliivibrio fischeri]MBP3157123.1 hypothetical protein [Aliivibrio fischeri]MCE7575192.1 hypothetical protein [Aliivibrio fischeri]MUJ21338.1 hypothetical protein [Aliivibrio fischeri]TDM54668.1 hypothetical protein VFFQA001_08965 [Aliivibrio fischeri]
MSKLTSQDIKLVINSLLEMAFDAPESLAINVNYRSILPSLHVNVYGQENEVLMYQMVYFNDINKGLQDLLEVEAELAELIIKAKDYAEVAV